MVGVPIEWVVEKAIFAEVTSLQGVDTFWLNPVAKAIFGLASVTFEVHACG